MRAYMHSCHNGNLFTLVSSNNAWSTRSSSDSGGGGRADLEASKRATEVMAAMEKEIGRAMKSASIGCDMVEIPLVEVQADEYADENDTDSRDGARQNPSQSGMVSRGGLFLNLGNERECVVRGTLVGLRQCSSQAKSLWQTCSRNHATIVRTKGTPADSTVQVPRGEEAGRMFHVCLLANGRPMG